MGGTECEGTTLTIWPTKDGTARGAGAQAVAIGQLGGETGSAAERLCDGTLPCSSILQSSWTGIRTRPRQATAPRAGWSWKSSTRAVNNAFMGSHYYLGAGNSSSGRVRAAITASGAPADALKALFGDEGDHHQGSDGVRPPPTHGRVE
jgi:hypothetical protein